MCVVGLFGGGCVLSSRDRHRGGGAGHRVPSGGKEEGRY